MKKVSKNLGLLAIGFAIGSVGIKLLTSKDAKKCYTHATAAVLRGKDEVVKAATKVQENAMDIYEDAKAINAERKAKENVVVEDAAE